MAPLDKLNGNQLLMEYLAGGRLVFKLLSVWLFYDAITIHKVT
jgi:hypothetical protein